MRIHPAGRKREMIAQSFSEAAPDFNTGVLGTPEVAEPAPPAVPEDAGPDTSVEPATEAPEVTEDKHDIKNYVAQKLQSFGYPPRRLEQFEDDFVTQKIFPGGVREVTIVIPDRYYGKRNSITDADFAKILEEVQGSFGLTFVDGERKEKKIEINFTSEKPTAEDDEEGEVVGDELDEVYGKATNGQKPKKKVKVRRPVAAEVSHPTTHAMIKESFDRLHGELLRMVLEKKNDTENV